MNYAATLVLLLTAFFLFSAGSEWLGFVALAGAVLAAIVPERRPPPAPAPVAATRRGMPVYAQASAGKIPQTMRIRIKRKSRMKSHWEDFGLAIGSVLESVGSTVFKLVSGGHAESEKEQVEAPKGR